MGWKHYVVGAEIGPDKGRDEWRCLLGEQRGEFQRQEGETQTMKDCLLLKKRKSTVRTLVLLNPSESQNLFSPSSESQACEFSPLLGSCGVGISGSFD